MIYRNMNGGRNLPDINSYRMAQRNLSFTNNRGENFTIEEGTVFTFSADYFQEYGRYHVNIKCYEFSGMIGVNTVSGENGSIFSVQDAILQKMNADGLNRFIDEVETGTVSMQKDILEKKIQQNPGVAKHCREMGLLMQKHREAEKEAEAMAQLIKEKKPAPPEKKKVDLRKKPL